MLEKLKLVSFYRPYSTGAIDVNMNWAVFKIFKRRGLSFSFKLDWGSHTVSIAKTATKNWSLDSLYEVPPYLLSLL